MSDVLRREDVIKHIKNRLYESACNNTTYQCNADEVFTDIAENRIETWINEMPSYDWTEEENEEIFLVICDKCGHAIRIKKEM